MSATIVVTGDLVWDYNLIQHPAAPSSHHVPFMQTVMQTQHGGAWYLESLLRKTCALKDISVRGVKPNRVNIKKCASQAYSIWAPHERDKTDTNAQGDIWRISQFLGCHPMHLKHEGASGGTGLDKPSLACPASCAGCLISDSPAPDILVLDDLALGFQDMPVLWPAALRKRGEPGKIVLKASSPLGKGKLWDILLKEHADRLTVVLSADILRARGAAISTALSWDKTIEETVKEFERGQSAGDLARCRRVVIHFSMEGAICFTRCALGMGIDEVEPGGDLKQPTIDPAAVATPLGRFERFVYDPDLREGDWKARHPGQTFGATSILTASVVRHELQPADYPIFIAIGRALAAMRMNHLTGGGDSGAAFKPEKALESVAEQLHPAEHKREPAREFCAAFPHAVLAEKTLRAQKADHSDLLRDFTGAGMEYVAAVAADVVLRGAKEALRAAPKAKYGRYLTVDREEIERINSISNLIRTYINNSADRRPLSIAVFGPAGSGKSFAIKELASDLFGATRAVLEFNLSQFSESSGDLHAAFHCVRDAAVHGKIPLVFWDEFDTDELNWLKYFLAPMQDAEFRAANILHPFGKAIFVFAGGTEATFEDFIDKDKKDAGWVDQKGPDFISRLRGYVNIKGPNPKDVDHHESDPACLIRRAMVLRVILECDYGRLLDKDKKASISGGVIRGFLRAGKFFHGARSMQAIISMCDLDNAQQFGVAALPPLDLLKMHVSDDFMHLVLEGQLEEPVIEALAEACHEAWRRTKESDGWKYGEKRDDKKKLHPLLRPYAELTEPQKDQNRLPARLTQAILDEAGYRIQSFRGGKMPGAKTAFTADDRATLMNIEHDIWLRSNLLDGYQWAPRADSDLRLHPDIAPFENVPPGDQKLDSAIVDSILPTIHEHGYGLVKKD